MKSLYISIVIQLAFHCVSFSQIQFKTELASVECLSDSELKVNLIFLIKESSGNKPELLNQNYRIVLGLTGIIENTISVVSEGDFSQFGVNAEGENYFYLQNTITGSKGNHISYNIECATPRGNQITDEWIKIGEVQFHTDATEDCFTVNINEPTTLYFPTYIDQFNLGVAETIIDSGFSYCLSQDCEIITCKEDVELHGGTDDITNAEVVIKASKAIMASNKIHTNSAVIYSASQEVLLEPNFEVKETSTFKIMLEGCIQ